MQEKNMEEDPIFGLHRSVNATATSLSSGNVSVVVDTPISVSKMQHLTVQEKQRCCALLYKSRDCEPSKRLLPNWQIAAQTGAKILWLHCDCAEEEMRQQAKKLYGSALTFPCVIANGFIYQFSSEDGRDNTSKLTPAKIIAFAFDAPFPTSHSISGSNDSEAESQHSDGSDEVLTDFEDEESVKTAAEDDALKVLFEETDDDSMYSQSEGSDWGEEEEAGNEEMEEDEEDEEDEDGFDELLDSDSEEEDSEAGNTVKKDHHKMSHTLAPNELESAEYTLCCLLFYWHECGHCKRLAPIWNACVHAATQHVPAVHWCAVDITRETKLFDEHGGGGVPKIFIRVKKSGQALPYEGNRSVNGIMGAIQSHLAREQTGHFSPSSSLGSVCAANS